MAHADLFRDRPFKRRELSDRLAAPARGPGARTSRILAALVERKAADVERVTRRLAFILEDDR